MYSEQLRRILGEIEPSTRAHFRGVFAIDELTQTRCKPGSYVINLDKRDEPGSHWVAVYVDPNKTFNNYDDEEEEDEDEGSLAPTETRLSAAAAADKATPSTTTTTQFMHVPHTAQTRHPSSRQRCGMLVEYFDSYGRAPPSPELNRFLGRFAAAAAAASHRRHQHPITVVVVAAAPTAAAAAVLNMVVVPLLVTVLAVVVVVVVGVALQRRRFQQRKRPGVCGTTARVYSPCTPARVASTASISSYIVLWDRRRQTLCIVCRASTATFMSNHMFSRATA